MKIKRPYLLFILFVPCLWGCEYFNPGIKKRKACTYDFIRCTDGRIEKSYENHRAMVIKTTENNALPSPYDKEFYRIHLDPDKNFPKESGTMFVIPCSELPEKFRKDSLIVSVSGLLMSCRALTISMPNARLVGSPVFIVRDVK